MESNIKLSSVYKFDCYRGDKLVWTETKENLVVDTGLELAMDCIFGDLETPTFYVGLIGNNSSIFPEDTASDHAFEEFLGSTNNARAVSNFVKGEYVGNTFTYVSTDTQFMIGTGGIVYGAFLITEGTKGGNMGILYGASIMGMSKPVIPGDALLVTITVSAQG